MIYFDSAATTLQKPETVPTAVAEAIRTMTTPGRGDYPAAHRLRETAPAGAVFLRRCSRARRSPRRRP